MPATYRFLLAVGFCLLAPHSGFAQQTLAWNLQVGDRIRMVTSHDVALVAEVDNRSVGMSHRTVVQLVWQVTQFGGEQDGTRMNQSVERVKVRLNAPGSDELTFDTAGGDQPVGPARQLAAAVAPLLAARATLNVHSDGRVSNVRLLGNASPADNAPSPAAEAFSRFLTREGIVELSGLTHVALPQQAVSRGDRWTRKSEMQTAAGPFVRTATYELAGEEIRDGRQLAKVDFTWTLSPRDEPEPLLPGEPEATPAARIERQDNKGVILFDTANGHPVETIVEQRLTFVSHTGPQKVRQQVASEMKVRISKLPRDAPQ